MIGCAMFFSASVPISSTLIGVCRRHLPDASGDADAARFNQRFRHRDDHAIAQQIVALCDYLALMHADAQLQAFSIGRNRSWMAMAQRKACTALAKAMRKPSPVVLNSRPPCVAATAPTRRAACTRASAAGRPFDHCRIADDIGCQNAGQTAVDVIHA
jgi:hypothetical protein